MRACVVLYLLYPCVFCQPMRWVKHQFSGSHKPSARAWAAAGYDSSREFLAIFGGMGKDQKVLNDTWVLDYSATRWYYVAATALSPPARFGMVHGLADGKFYIFGGQNATCYFNDVWAFDMSSFKWERLSFGGHLRPSGRAKSAGGIFPGGSVLLETHGWDGSYQSDSYLLDFAAQRWFQLEDHQISYSPIAPHPRTDHGSAMISPTQLLIFGGCVKHGPCPAGDSWILDTESRKWTLLDECAPCSRNSMIAYLRVGVKDYALVFGGDTTGRQIFGGTETTMWGEMYVFDLTKQKWSVRLIETDGLLPTNRIGATSVSTDQSFVLIFGGKDLENNFHDELWEIRGDPSQATESSVRCQTSHFTLISLHGFFMFLGFGICLIFGAAIAYYGVGVADDTRLSWRYIHIVAQITGSVLSLLGFVCGLVLIPEGVSHFSSVHGCLGLVIFLLLFLQGLLIPASRYYEQWYGCIMNVHFWHGLALVILSVINSSLGLFLAMASTAIWISYFCYVLIVAVIFCAAQALSIFTGDNDSDFKPYQV